MINSNKSILRDLKSALDEIEALRQRMREKRSARYKIAIFICLILLAVEIFIWRDNQLFKYVQDLFSDADSDIDDTVLIGALGFFILVLPFLWAEHAVWAYKDKTAEILLPKLAESIRFSYLSRAEVPEIRKSGFSCLGKSYAVDMRLKEALMAQRSFWEKYTLI